MYRFDDNELANAYRVAVDRFEEIQELKKENEKLKAVHWLLAWEDAFVSSDHNPFFYPSAEVSAKGECRLALNCGDTFAYATADAEPFTKDDAVELMTIAKREGWPGLIRWIQARRPGEEVIKPAAAIMTRYDDALTSLRLVASDLYEALLEGGEPTAQTAVAKTKYEDWDATY